MIFVVLGMHKSGTTLVSQILHHSGVSMGVERDGGSYDAGNKYERQDCLHLNMSILGTVSYQVLYLKRPSGVALNSEQQQTMQTIIRTSEEAGADWGFKDPRTCLTYDLWRVELPPHKIVAIYRAPDQIWQRFKWLGKRKYHTNFGRAYAFLERWHEHNIGILCALAETSMPYIIINYHDFVTADSELRRLEEFVGQPLQDRRRRELYRCRAGNDYFLRAADKVLQARRKLSIAETMKQLAAKGVPEREL